jgi:hypothetical protein
MRLLASLINASAALFQVAIALSHGLQSSREIITGPWAARQSPLASMHVPQEHARCRRNSLGQAHLDELRVQTLYVRQHEKLLDGSAIAHIALESGIGVAPLFGGLAKQSDVEKISFAGVSTGGLRSANHSWDEVGLNRIGVDPVVEF